MDYPSLVFKRPMSGIYRNYIVANSSVKRVIVKTAVLQESCLSKTRFFFYRIDLSKFVVSYSNLNILN